MPPRFAMLTAPLLPSGRADNVEAVANAPVGLQLHGRKNEEEAVLRMTEIVDAALKAARSAQSIE